MSDATPAFNPHESGYRWVIVALAATSFTMAFVSRFAWPPLVPAASASMGIDFAQAMYYMSAFYIGYVITQIPGGVLADRFGPRLVLGSAMILQGLGTIGMGYTNDYAVGNVMRIICGLGAGCVYSSCLKSIVTWVEPVKRGLAIGILMTSPTIGVTIPNMLMPYLSDTMGLGWQGAFRFIGWAIVIFAVALFALMKEVKTVGGGPRKSFLVGLKFVFSTRNILLISLAGFSCIWCQIGFTSVGNAYMVKTLGVTQAEAGKVMAIYGLIGILMPALAGYLSDKNPTKKPMMIIACHVLMIVLFLAFGQMTTLVACGIVASCIGLVMAFANPIYTIIIAENAGPEWAATAGGVGNCIFQIGAIISPALIGMATLKTGSYAATWWILAAGAVIGIITTAMVTNKVPEQANA